MIDAVMTVTLDLIFSSLVYYVADIIESNSRYVVLPVSCVSPAGQQDFQRIKQTLEAQLVLNLFIKFQAVSRVIVFHSNVTQRGWAFY